MADELVVDVESQPLRSQVRRIVEALEYIGQPLDSRQHAALMKLENAESNEYVTKIQQLLDQLVIANVHINAESRVKVTSGPAKPDLVQNGWSTFLIKVHNEAGITPALRIDSPSNQPIFIRSGGAKDPDPGRIDVQDIEDRWLELGTFDKQPLMPNLSGLTLEYRILSIYAATAGQREATLTFDAGQGTQDLGFRSELPILFKSRESTPVTLRVFDHDGSATVGQFVIRDKQGRIYPSRFRRLEPDFYFHDQIYRYDKEVIHLPPGNYEFVVTRGPEYIAKTHEINITDRKPMTLEFRLERWIKMLEHGWISGDHHIHAAGCAHYDAPRQGVLPEAMMRHILGEDLNVGCVLTWGPCWYFQKDFFEGKNHSLSRRNYLMRYDIEVSGFPSSHAGHLCLLRLREDDYPGTTRVEEWPTWDLPVLRWGKEQGGVVGFSHSGWGLQVDDQEMPSFAMPKFDGIGANEFIVDVTHGVVDFISAVDTPLNWELSIWYHTLNCGFDTRISGETDFPCIYGDRVGLGRSYVKLNPKRKVSFDDWIHGIRDGRSYVGDGRSHLFNFEINGIGVGERSKQSLPSYQDIAKGQSLAIRVNASAMLDETENSDIRSRPYAQKPYWHIERARKPGTNQVPVELIVNGEVVETRYIQGSGEVRELTFQYTPSKSSWIALRILGACHTNPIFLIVDDQPIRANKASAEWCLQAVDVCWNAKKGRISPDEIGEAKVAWDHARQTFARILKETE
ncbi:MAG: CehA/McbA family metallohydrolase [Planctomycetota bacterium]|nr:CehA/McbA family metallohydrolase [Planctomycetota bacterium]